MPSDIEMQKRANYHDLGRDDWMSLDEYLQSGLSDKDLGKAGGGLASLPGYAPGGPVGSEYIPGQNVNKIMENIASIRFDKESFFKGVQEAGYVKKDGSVDLKAFEKHLNRKGLSMWKMKSQRMMNNVTNELNDLLEGKYYKNVKKYSRKSMLENLASKFKGFKGKYAEAYASFSKEQFWDDALKLQEKADKKFGTKKLEKKLKWVVDALKKKWPTINIGTTMTALSKLGFSMALGPSMIGAELMTEESVKPLAEIISGKKEPLTYKGGGMTNIYDMTKPLGYYRGGPARDPESYEGFEPILKGYGESLANLQNKEYARKWNLTKPRQPGLDEQLMQDYVPPRPRWEKARELGKKGLEGIKGLGSKSIDALKRLAEETIGAGAAEGSTLKDYLETYIPILKIRIDNLEAAGEDATGFKNRLEYYEDLLRRQE